MDDRRFSETIHCRICAIYFNDSSLYKEFIRLVDILSYGDHLLRQKALEISDFPPSLRTLANDMYQTMLSSDGIGLAAPQIGEGIRLIVVDTQESNGIGKLILVNPSWSCIGDEKEEMDEGCLSIPGISAPVLRAYAINVTAQRLNGRPMRFHAEGLLARVIQHEVDHLDGRLFVDYIEEGDRSDDMEEKLEMLSSNKKRAKEASHQIRSAYLG